jgi:hypothetical protein
MSEHYDVIVIGSGAMANGLRVGDRLLERPGAPRPLPEPPGVG